MKLKLQDKTLCNVVPVLAAHAHTTFNIQFIHFFLVLYHEHLEQLVIKTTLVRTQIKLSLSSASV